MREDSMRAVIQRVSEASVRVNNGETRSIGKGLIVLLGIARGDSEEDAVFLARKISYMRIFEDGDGKMNLSIDDMSGEVLIVSQFTLMASTRKGNRPSFDPASPPEEAVPLYDFFVREMKRIGKGRVVTGEFGAHMRVSLVNEGPVTIIMDSHTRE